MRSARLLLGLVAFCAALGLAALLLRPRENRTETPAGQTATERVMGPEENARTVGTARQGVGRAAGQATAGRVGGATEETGTRERNTLALLGTIQPVAQAALSSRLPARITAVPVREGQAVRRGQLLVQLDAGEMQAQERTAQAGVIAAL